MTMKGEMISYDADEDGWVKVVMDVPARGLIGYMAGEFKNDVHGQGCVAFLVHQKTGIWLTSPSPERSTTSSKVTSHTRVRSTLGEMVH